jgi:23S rRNA pseudouridine1911/1915/1917 synthase
MISYPIRVEVLGEADGQRVDSFLAGRDIGLTRSQAERLAKAGKVFIGGRSVAAGHRVVSGDVVEVESLPRVAGAPAPEPIPLEVLFEDQDLLVINKPSGLVVHPGVGRDSGTIVNALLARGGSLAKGAGEHRPGIVHRLDKDTSGLMVVAKTDAAYADLAGQVKRREMDRRYLALVWGNVREDRLVIDVPIGRHLADPTRMAAVSGPSEGRRTRAARTDVRVVERYGPMTLVEARLETGRTHQIRVHLAHQGHPVVGDPTYGLRRARQGQASISGGMLTLVRGLRGQALHAHMLRFRHPTGGQEITLTAPMPPDMASLVSHLSHHEP